MTNAQEITDRFAHLQEIELAVAEWLEHMNEIAPKHTWGNYTFTLERSAGKYSRVVQRIVYTPDNGRPAQTDGGSVHAFVELATGRIAKPAGWKAPTKTKDGKFRAAYDLTVPESRAAIIRDADWAGGYLYVGGQSYRLPQA